MSPTEDTYKTMGKLFNLGGLGPPGELGKLFQGSQPYLWQTLHWGLVASLCSQWQLDPDKNFTFLSLLRARSFHGTSSGVYSREKGL